jgi:Replication-relaxation
VRYWKGSIALSSTRDYPLLRHVFQSGFITHNQLFELLKLDYCAASRNAFNNRVLRLVKHGLLSRQERLSASRDVVYSMSMSGALALGVNGNLNHSIVNRASNINNRQLYHSLDLNEIHLALKRSASLVYWMPETEVRSRTDLTPYGYWKYYDAVVVVRLAGQDCKFALEYERTPKAARQYVAIRERIEQETAIRHFLYLVPNHDFLWFIAEKLSQCRRAVYIGLFQDFLEQTLALPVRRSGSPATLTLASVLVPGKETQHSGELFSGVAV